MSRAYRGLDDATPAIALDGLTKRYSQRGKPDVVSVDALDLVVPPGQVCALLGPNGAGKTTTIKMICGLIVPSAGRVAVHGSDVSRERSAVMRQLGAVLEGSRTLYWRLSSWQNLIYFGRLKGRAHAEIVGRAEQLLRELGLWERRDVPVGDFSRGMQQKVAIAAALIHDPAVVLLDEPTLGLDVNSARTVKAWVKQLAEEQGKTIILTSHELGMVEEVSERVAILRQGRLIADKPIGDLLSLFRQERFRIELDAPLDNEIATTFADFMPRAQDTHTVLQTPFAEQEKLHTLLAQIRDRGLPLVAVARVEPRLEDIFIDLTNTTEHDA